MQPQSTPPTPTTKERLLNRRDAFTYLGLSPDTFSWLVNTGRLSTFRIQPFSPVKYSTRDLDLARERYLDMESEHEWLYGRCREVLIEQLREQQDSEGDDNTAVENSPILLGATTPSISPTPRRPAGWIKHDEVQQSYDLPKTIATCAQLQGWIYFVTPIAVRGPVKIGRATCIASRLRELDTFSPFRLQLLAVMLPKEPNPRNLERQLHKHFAKQRLHGEWFAWKRNIIDYLHNNARIVDLPVQEFCNEVFALRPGMNPSDLPWHRGVRKTDSGGLNDTIIDTIL